MYWVDSNIETVNIRKDRMMYDIRHFIVVVVVHTAWKLKTQTSSLAGFENITGLMSKLQKGNILIFKNQINL